MVRPFFLSFSMIVYCSVCGANGKLYVGKTEGPLEARMAEHMRASRSNTRIGNSVFHRAIKKYGPEAFSTIVLGTAGTSEELAELEKHFIRVLKTRTPHGYNLTEGGEGLVGYIPSEETRARLRAAGLGKQRRLGIPHSAEDRAKISAVLRRNAAQLSARAQELWKDPDFRARQIAARKGKPRNLTPEGRAALRESCKRARAAKFWSTKPKAAVPPETRCS